MNTHDRDNTNSFAIAVAVGIAGIRDRRRESLLHPPLSLAMTPSSSRAFTSADTSAIDDLAGEENAWEKHPPDRSASLKRASRV